MGKSKELMRFGAHKFYVTANEIKSFKSLKIKATLNTEDANSDAQKYTSKKGNGALEVNFTAVFDARLGSDVYTEANSLIHAAVVGEQGKLYFLGGKKALDAQLMVTEAEIDTVDIIGGGKWLYAEVKVTLKQCTGAGASSSGSGSGGGGGSGKYYKVRAPQAWNYEKKVWATSVSDAISKAGLGKYTGYVHVDDSRYYLKDGVITTQPSASGSTNNSGSSTTTVAQQDAQNAQQAEAQVTQTVMNLFGQAAAFLGGNK